MNNYGQPYYMNMGMPAYGYQSNYGNMQPNTQPVPQQMQQMQQQVQKPQMEQYNQPMYKQPFLQGKSVDNADVVKVMDIPLDGSVSYFPVADGSAILTKQLQPDGTSKILVYKIENQEVSKEEQKDKPKYITIAEANELVKKVDNSEFKEDMKIMKRRIKEITEDIKDINDIINKGKD